jgi:hypothetical protein
MASNADFLQDVGLSIRPVSLAGRTPLPNHESGRRLVVVGKNVASNFGER